MIVVEGLTKTFTRGRRGWRAKPDRVDAVRDLSFIAPDGAITALLGPNGAGKTTTLRILATLVRADAGHARVGAHDVERNPLDVRADIGVLSDARGLYTRLTARENIRYFGALRGTPPARLEQRIRELARLLEFEHLLDERTEGFSTGERLKVALARTLVHDPHHVILDEPTNGLDVLSTRALRRMLMRLRDAGKCIVFSSHIMQEVDLLCDRVVIVAHGRHVAHGDVPSLLAQTGASTLEDAFVALAFTSQRQGA
ncbi:MAG TPA: ATP-binding cassette domain-containing protein [Burkholderiaceae bacterium]|nr:ATP-binding cassette domain-containing protein [Burkholderiaceae bacterium]